MRQKLKTAMLGVGDITFLHYPAYEDYEHAELALLCDLDETLLKERAEQWGIDKITTDFNKVLNDPDIDIIEINTPHHMHKKHVIEALQAGKHVACQKPIATSVSDAAAMVAASKRSTGRFRVLENFVFYPPYVMAKELIDAGEIGDPLTIRFKLGTGLFGSRWVPLKSELWHMAESEKGMGQAVFDDGYHKLSLAMFFFGDIEEVQGYIDRSFKYADAPAQLMWRYKNTEVLGSFDIALSLNLYTHSKYFPADERVTITGTRGIIQLTRCTAQIMNEPAMILYRDGKRYMFDDLETDWQSSFTAGIRDFPLAIKEGRETLLTGERAADIVSFAYALIIAAKKGEAVRPDTVSDEMVKNELLKGGAVT